METKDFLDRILTNARSGDRFTDKPVTDADLKAIYDYMRWGPTSSNCSPARFVFAKSKEALEAVAATASNTNAKTILSAPVCAIIAYDLKFFENLGELFPANPDASKWMASSEQVAFETAFRNGTLQGAYFILAARALGWDCAPMSGFKKDALDEAFFAGTSWRTNFICPFGVVDPESYPPRPPRLDFDRACEIR